MPDRRPISIRAGRDAYTANAMTFHGETSQWRTTDLIRTTREDLQKLPLSQLLAPRNRVVMFAGRQAELESLLEWRDDDRPLSARLVYGRGGQGKTRLGLEFAYLSQAAGWLALSAVYAATGTVGTVEESTEGGHGGLLLLIDYAERWPPEDLRALFEDFACIGPTPLRILLSSRTIDWWASVRKSLADLGYSVDQVRLRPLGSAIRDRARLFNDARASFTSALGLQIHETAATIEHSLSDSAFELVLAIHMAALATVDGLARGRTIVADPVRLSAYLLDREYEHWQLMHRLGRTQTNSNLLGRSVFIATLAGPLSPSNSISAMRDAGLALSDNAMLEVLDDHRVCYPPSVAINMLEPLYPDRLGEDFLALRLPGHRVVDFESDPWAAEALHHLIGDDSVDCSLPRVRHTITALAEASARWPHVAQNYLFPMLERFPRLAFASGGSTLSLIVGLLEGRMSALIDIERALPEGESDELNVGVAELVRALSEHRLSQASGLQDRALLYGQLGHALANSGRLQEALEATQNAVSIFRELADPGTGAHVSDLVKALGALARDLSAVGRDTDGLAAAEEAVGIAREGLRAGNVEQPNVLVDALDSLSTALSDVGQVSSALLLAQESVERWRHLVSDSPNRYESELASALNSLSAHLSDAGRNEDALIAAREAAAVYATLADSSSENNSENHASSLVTMSAILTELGRRSEALREAVRAADIYRSLADLNARRFDPDLADSLNGLAVSLSDVGRDIDAFWCAQESLEIYRGLFEKSPARFGPDLARALDNFGVFLTARNRYIEALASTEESVRIYEQLAYFNSERFEPDLARSLRNLAVGLRDCTQLDDAVIAAERAVALYRGLSAERPRAFSAELAHAINNLAEFQVETGKAAAALSGSQEAVAIARAASDLERENRSRTETLALCLWTFGAVRAKANRELGDGLAALDESSELYERLTLEHPEAFSSDLRGVLEERHRLRNRL